MAAFDAFLKTLASQLKGNVNLRHALIETLLAAMEDESSLEQLSATPLSYLDLLDQLDQQRIQAEQAGNSKLSVAFQRLSDQIRQELIALAMALHHTLRSKSPVLNSQLLQQIGVDLHNFPVVFPKIDNFLKLSINYVNAVRDLYLLQTCFPGKFPGCTSKIEQERQHLARQLRHLAWKTLSTGLFSDPDLIKFHQTCLQVFQTQQPTAKQKLTHILRSPGEAEGNETLAYRLTMFGTWLYEFYPNAKEAINSLSSADRKIALKLLIRSNSDAVLELLPEIELVNDSEQTLFITLLTLRFSSAFQTPGENWQRWLRELPLRDAVAHWNAWLKWQLDKRWQQSPTFTFWQAHPYYLPKLAAGQIKQLAVPEALNAKLLETLKDAAFKELFERRYVLMTAQEIQIINAALKTPPPKVKQEPESVASLMLETAVATAVDVAVDVAVKGGISETILVTAADEGAKVFEHKLAVAIDDEDREPKRLSIEREEEPGASLWRNHIYPFISQNLVFVLAPSLIFIGLLLLVVTLWDKAAWIRYGLAPGMLVGVSYTLTRIGLWLKDEDIPSETPRAILSSVAILLAPMSLLFVALLSVDWMLALPVKMIWGLCLSAALLAAWSRMFKLSIQAVYTVTTGVHNATLLLLNTLLLLLPVAQLTMTPESQGLNLHAKIILVSGFYAGFLVLSWSMRKVLSKMIETLVKQSGSTGSPQTDSSQTDRPELVEGREIAVIKLPMIFYAVTCLGTYLLVWVLTYARLMILPGPATYAPLLALFGFLVVMTEFKLLTVLQKTGRITAFSYAAYFFIGLGIMLSVGHDYGRVITLLIAGLVWFYQASKLNDSRHFTLSLVLLTGACSMIALIKAFPASFFPYLALLIVIGLHSAARLAWFAESQPFVDRVCPIYLSLAFIIAIAWQWTQALPPFHYGAAFVLFGVYALYLGAKTNRLIYVHAGMGYLAAALPYFGLMDIQRQTLDGNTLVFGFAAIGVIWTLFSGYSGVQAFRDSRSTVLWNIGVLALCLMAVRLIVKEIAAPSETPFLQFQMLSGPIIIGLLMLLVGYFTRSYLPVYFGLLILVVIFPEIKDRFNIPMYSGLGSTFSGAGLLLLGLAVNRWKPRDIAQADLIWRKQPFPFQAQNSGWLYANPFIISALFLFTRTVFSTYPMNVFKPEQAFTVRTLIAVALCGTAYHVLSVWFRQSAFSYLGFLAIGFGFIHSAFIPIRPGWDVRFLPILILLTLLYWGGIRLTASNVLPAESAKYILRPFWRLTLIALWLSTIGVYWLYSLTYAASFGNVFFGYWLLLILYLGTLSGWLAWKKPLPLLFIPTYFLLWQLIILATTPNRIASLELLFDYRLYLNTAWMVLGVVAAFFIAERALAKPQYRRLSPLLWMSLVLLGVLSFLLAEAFYFAGSSAVLAFRLIPQLLVWAMVSLMLGRFLNFGFLWLWGLFLLYLPFMYVIREYTQFRLTLNPLLTAVFAIVLASLSVMTARLKWLYDHKYAYSWARNRWIAPSFLLTAAAHVGVILVFVQSFASAYANDWLTIPGMFLAALPALFAAQQLVYSRRVLFGVPYLIAWIRTMFILKFHFPEHDWLVDLHTLELIGCGLFMGLLTAVISDVVRPCRNLAYRALTSLTATGVIFLSIEAYLAVRDVGQLSLSWLVISGVLTLGAGLYFRYVDTLGWNADNANKADLQRL